MTLFSEKSGSMFQFLTHVELSRSMVAILEMPQYVAYQKNVAYALFTLSTKSHTFNRYCTIMPLSGAYTINNNDMLSYSLTNMMCFLTKERYGFLAYAANLFIKAYHRIMCKEDLKIT